MSKKKYLLFGIGSLFLFIFILILAPTLIPDPPEAPCDMLCDKAFAAASMVAIDEGFIIAYTRKKRILPERIDAENLVMIEALEQRIVRYKYHLYKAVSQAQEQDCPCVPTLDDMEMWIK